MSFRPLKVTYAPFGTLYQSTSSRQETLENVLTATIVLTSTVVVLEVTSVT